MSEEVKTNMKKPFVVKTTVGSLLKDLKKLQDKYGPETPVVTLNLKEFLDSKTQPTDIALVKVRGPGPNAPVDHLVLTDHYGTALITGQREQLLENEIKEAAAIIAPPVSDAAPAAAEDRLNVSASENPPTPGESELPEMLPNESVDDWAKRAFPDSVVGTPSTEKGFDEADLS